MKSSDFSYMTLSQRISYTALPIVGLFFVFALTNSANAQTVTQMPQRILECVTLNHNLKFGQHDNVNDENISYLQEFLSQKSFLPRSALGTGRFGPLTRKAVTAYQKSVAISPTGFVGLLTRERIHTDTCGNPVTPGVVPVLYSVTPTILTIGTTTSISGFGFTASNTILMDGLVAAREVPITSSIAVTCTTDPSCHGGIRQTLIFSLPETLTTNCYGMMMCPLLIREITPGTYTLTVTNENGVSKPHVVTVATSTSPYLSTQ